MKKIHRRQLRKKGIIKRRILITTLLFSLTFTLAIGYSAFSTAINLSAKGNIYKVSDKCYEAKDNGDGTVSITDYDKTCGSEVNIPSTIKGLTVTKIGNHAFENKGIMRLLLPDTLIEIGTYSFHRNEIETLILPNSLITVGSYAFQANNIKDLKMNNGLKQIKLDAFNQNYLTEINIPSSVTYMEGGAFSGNKFSGDEAFIYGINPDGSTNYSILNSYAGKDATGTIIPDTVTTIQREAYVNIKYEEITIPSRIKIIPEYCFANSGANKIIIEYGVEKLYGMAFVGSNITDIDLPSSIIQISQNTFSDNENLKTININKPENSISGAPWGAVNANVNWNGTD